MSKAYDIVMEDRKKIVDKIIENMEKGDLIFSKNWDSQMMMPKNPVSKANYLGGNRVRLIAKAIENEYKDPRWVTFKQAAENGWNVIKGEKGTLCEKWIFTKKEKEIDKDGKEVEKEVKLDKPLVNYFYVFNAEQIENIPKLEINNFTKDETNEIVQDFINSSECNIKEVAQDKAYYNPGKDEIVLPLRESFNSSQDFLKTTFHEMVHSTGHKDRLNRDLSSGFGSEKYAKEELVAELGSVFLQSKLGIKLEGEHFDNHSAYLKSWISILKNDSNELFRAAAQAEKASERLHERYLEYAKEKVYLNEREKLFEYTKERIEILSKDGYVHSNNSIFEINRYFKKYLEEKNISTEAAAKELNINIETLKNYNEGNQVISVEDYLKISEVYKIDIISSIYKDLGRDFEKVRNEIKQVEEKNIESNKIYDYVLEGDDKNGIEKGLIAESTNDKENHYFTDKRELTKAIEKNEEKKKTKIPKKKKEKEEKER